MNFSFQHLLSLCPERLLARIIALKNVPQRPDFHPEGSVWTHTGIVVGRLAKYRSPILSWAGVLHDIGKDSTSAISDKGFIQAIGHELVSAQLVYEYSPFLEDLGVDHKKVKEIVENHMRIKLYEKMKTSKQMELRGLSTYGYLDLFKDADNMANPIPTEEEIGRIYKGTQGAIYGQD